MKAFLELDGRKMVKLTFVSEGADDPETIQQFYELYRYGWPIREENALSANR